MGPFRRAVRAAVTVFVVMLGLSAAGAGAQTSCPATNLYSLNFAAQPVTQLSYATNYSYTASSVALGTRPVSVSFAAPAGYNAATGIGTLPRIAADVNGGTGNALIMGGIMAARTTNISSTTNVLVTTVGFGATPVRELTMTIHDIDYSAAQFRDWIKIVGVGPAGNYVPALTTPHGTANIGGPFTALPNSSVKLGPQASSPATAADEGVGVGSSGNNGNTGNITIRFAQPVSSVILRYGNYPLQAGDSSIGQQFYALSTLSFCPMPNLVIDKTSAPVVTTITDPNRFNIPGASVDYTITVTNNGGSTVDINSAIIGDILPATVTFFNGDIDTVTAGTQNVVFTPGSSGVTLAAANTTYSNNGGASYVYTPAAGFDTAVNGLRFNPQGTMAANSTFTIRFRTRVR